MRRTTIFVLLLLYTSLSNAALLGRDLDGNFTTAEAYYDDTTNLTWLADANHAMVSGYDPDGQMNQYDSKVWAQYLDPYGSGVTGWRLPTMVDIGNDGCNWSYFGTDCGYNIDTSSSEMGYLFYETLGNVGQYDVFGNALPGWELSNSGPFINIQLDHYWTDVNYVIDDQNGWQFDFRGFQSFNGDNGLAYAWAVHDGDVGVAVVPLPAAIWFFISGLFTLALINKKSH